MKERFLWIFFNPYGWLVFVMSIITAVIVQAWWVVLIGVIAYQTVLLLELTVGRFMGKSSAVQFAIMKQENRELHAEQARLLGAIQSRDSQVAELQARLEAGEAEKGPDQTPPAP